MPYSLCGTSVDNLGEQACDKSRGVLRKLFIFNGSIAEADYASTTAFLDKMIANSKLSKSDADKIFPLSEVQDITDSSESNKEGSLNQGFKAVLLEGKPAYKVKMFAGSDLYKRLRTFNNQSIRLVELDANGVFWGYKTGTSFKGFQAKVFFTGNKLATGQNVEEGVVEATVSILSVSEYFDNAYWMETPTGGNTEDIVPLIDVDLAYVSHVTNVLKYSMKIPGSNLVGPYSIGATHGTAIAALSAQFSAKSGAGTPATSLAITSMTYDATNDLLVVTYDNTAYNTATGNIKLIPPTPAQLDTADITETELLSVTHSKPA